MEQSQFTPNEGKQLEITTDFGVFARYPIKTHVVKEGDDLLQMMDEYVKPHLLPGDLLYISEKIVAISQGRAFPIEDIKPSRLAKFLCKFVYKSPYGIGLGSPWTMELALRDVGVPLILFAAFCSAITKPFGMRGVFYRIVGDRARAIDGPCSYTLPPYNHYAKLAPKEPNRVAQQLSDYIGNDVIIIDANDIGREILGKSKTAYTPQQINAIFADNPLGQGSQQTPMAIVRKIEKKEN